MSLSSGGSIPCTRLFSTPGCPHVLKCLIFLSDAQLMDRVEIVEDSAQQRAWVTEKAGSPAVFPALYTVDKRVIMFPDTEGIVDSLAQHFRVDKAKLSVYNHYVDGVYPRYGALLGNVIKSAGGWPAAFPSVGIKRLLLLGGTGTLGSRIAAEAKRRGHFVTVASRRAPAQALHATVDAGDQAALEATLRAGLGFHGVIVALGPASPNIEAAVMHTDQSKAAVALAPPSAPPLVEIYKSIVTACRSTGNPAFFVGCAGSLLAEGKGGTLQMDLPVYPELEKPAASQHADALDWLKTVDDVEWTSLAPSPTTKPGKRTGKYKLGGDSVAGSTISAEDFAVAMMDEVETPKHLGKRFSVTAADPEQN